VSQTTGWFEHGILAAYAKMGPHPRGKISPLSNYNHEAMQYALDYVISLLHLISVEFKQQVKPQGDASILGLIE